MFNFKSYFNKSKLFTSASAVADRLNVKAYVVGGFVRDRILGSTKNDIDFLVVGDGPKFANVLAEELNIKKVNIFKNFGTAQFNYRGKDLEFVGARKESYSEESRKPAVTAGTFDDDIDRRDFTINSMAVSLNKENFGELIDKYKGIDDLKNKLIRTPLDPKITFNDDPLRILRAIRFAAVLNFELDSSILQAAKKFLARLNIVSRERINTEFYKILLAPQPSIGLKLMHYTDVMKVVFPEISDLSGVEQRRDHHHKDVFLHTCKVVDNISKVTDNLWLRFAALVHDIAKPPTKRFVDGIGWNFHGHEELGARMMKGIFRKYKFPMSKLPYVQKLVKLHLRPIALVDEDVTDSAIRRLIVQADDDLNDLITLCRADITSKNPKKVEKYLANYERVMEKVLAVKEKDKLRAFQSPVKGDEIMKVFNLKPSKEVGIIKSMIENAILEGEIGNNYEEAYSYMLKLKEDNSINLTN